MAGGRFMATMSAGEADVERVGLMMAGEEHR
jgi:hypothetical protein